MESKSEKLFFGRFFVTNWINSSSIIRLLWWIMHSQIYLTV